MALLVIYIEVIVFYVWFAAIFSWYVFRVCAIWAYKKRANNFCILVLFQDYVALNTLLTCVSN